ncbi:MAG TPA: polysaccharide deacetylase family protein, partial [Aestuariivirga sp.]
LVLLSGQSSATSLIEYHMHMAPSAEGKRVALSFDACTGKVDERILTTLVDNKIEATIFVTGRWLKHNAPTITTLKDHPELFEIENHGAQHLAAVDKPVLIYGLRAAGSPDNVKTEVLGGAAAAKAAFGSDTTWFRGATGEYTQSSMDEIKALNFKLAGFTFSGDGGALFSSEHAARIIAKAQDGDVILAHINQPRRNAGAGVAEGILKLKAEGFSFVKLDEGF